MRIGVDVDGVLACFEAGFIPLLIKATAGKDYFPTPDGVGFTPTTWDWPTALGYTKAEQGRAWDLVKADGTFWASLPALPGAVDFLNFLREIADEGNDVYFITHRMGTHAKAQTEAWIWAHNGFDECTVLLSAKKAQVCAALDIDYYIDDKNENCRDVSGLLTTRTFMLAQPWNAAITGIPRLNSLDEFKGILEGAMHGR